MYAHRRAVEDGVCDCETVIISGLIATMACARGGLTEDFGAERLVVAVVGQVDGEEAPASQRAHSVMSCWGRAQRSRVRDRKGVLAKARAFASLVFASAARGRNHLAWRALMVNFVLQSLSVAGRRLLSPSDERWCSSGRRRRDCRHAPPPHETQEHLPLFVGEAVQRLEEPLHDGRRRSLRTGTPLSGVRALGRVVRAPTKPVKSVCLRSASTSASRASGRQCGATPVEYRCRGCHRRAPPHRTTRRGCARAVSPDNGRHDELPAPLPEVADRDDAVQALAHRLNLRNTARRRRLRKGGAMRGKRAPGADPR
jgi:hypothetical protein